MSSEFEYTSATTREFTLDFLKQITNNFSEDHIIGRGGYGVVYKGELDDGEEIALKRLHSTSGLDDTDFRNEFNTLMRAQHPNITRLVGYCYYQGHERIKLNGEYVFAHSEERVLCFEYMQGGSLDKHITDESCGLDWRTRFKIIKGVCQGLNYLHNGSSDHIVHLDLKPANILLDENMVPKIGDFGLSRLFPSAQTYITMKIIGTPGYMPPEYIDRCEITPKFDVFSLGVIMIRIIAGHEGYSKCAHMSSHEFLEHVHENWEKRLQAAMSSYTSEQVTSCIQIALRCVEVMRDKRPTIAKIVDDLNNLDSAESSPAGQVAKNQSWNSERRGRIVFSAPYRPLMPLDIFSLRTSSANCEINLTDGVSCNYNGRPIPPAALKILLKSPKLVDEGGTTDEDVDAGRVWGLVFVSERDDGLETLYIALCFNNANNRGDCLPPQRDGVKVFALADIFGTADFSGTRMEDSACIGGGYSVGSRSVDHCLIYVSTKEQVLKPRSPWTVVYKTNLSTGKTERLTPQGVFDLSPAVSPSGKTVAVASFQSNSGDGKVENLMTDIYVMNVDSEESPGLGRKLLIKNGGWPSWGSDNIIFFHRGTNKTTTKGIAKTSWGVFRYNISTEETIQVTPKKLDAVTPAAISETKVAVVVFVKPVSITQESKKFRHIQIFDTDATGLSPELITQVRWSKCDYYNPFVLDGGGRIGYHRCRTWRDLQQQGDSVPPPNLHRLESPVKNVGLFWVPGLLPAISKDGSKLAFVDSRFKRVWLADSQGPRIVYEQSGQDSVFSPEWNQNPDKDILYVCVGTSFNANDPLEIYSISNASGDAVQRHVQRLTYGGFNNASPSSSPDGNKFVFRSTRDFFPGKGNSQPTTRSWWNFDFFVGESSSPTPQPTREESQKKKHTNLYIMLKTDTKESEEGWVTRLTKGPWTDTDCQWSPKADWIVFSSTRDKPDDGLDLGYYSVYLVKASDPTVVIRVMESGGNISHPVFSLDGRSIAVTVDLPAVAVDPISLPKFKHGMWHGGQIFVVDMYIEDEKKNEYLIKGFRRVTHSRYECGTPAWTTTIASTTEPNLQTHWNLLAAKGLLTS